MGEDAIQALYFDPTVPRLHAAAAGDVIRIPQVHRLDLVGIVPDGFWQVPIAPGE
jgi:hypothetical protein